MLNSDTAEKNCHDPADEIVAHFLKFVSELNRCQMNIEEIREYCLAKAGVTEGFPFGQDVLVFKVMNKMFALTGLEGNPPYVNLKCDPDQAIELRAHYEEIQPGYHMNKAQWNSVYYTGSIPSDLLLELIDHSYELVVQGLKRADREALRLLNS